MIVERVIERDGAAHGAGIGIEQQAVGVEALGGCDIPASVGAKPVGGAGQDAWDVAVPHAVHGALQQPGFFNFLVAVVPKEAHLDPRGAGSIHGDVDATGDAVHAEAATVGGGLIDAFD